MGKLWQALARGAAALGVTLALIGSSASAQVAAPTTGKTLKFIPEADLRSLDGLTVAPVVFLWNVDKT